MDCCPDWPNLLNYCGLCENKYSNLLSPIFSERQREHSRLLIAVARPSVVCLSVVCNARAPYSGGCNFRQFLRYLVPWPSADIHKQFYGESPREPLRRES